MLLERELDLEINILESGRRRNMQTGAYLR